VMGLIISFIASINLVFMDPILTLRLQDIGVSENNAGLGFALLALTYTIGSGISGELAQRIDIRIIIGVALMFTGIALYLTSGLKSNNEAVTFVGLGLDGFFVACIFIPIVPEIIYAAEVEEKKEVERIKERIISISILDVD